MCGGVLPLRKTMQGVCPYSLLFQEGSVRIHMVHIVEGIAAMIVILCIVDGWRRGLLLKLYGLARFVVIIVLTILLTPLVYQVLPFEMSLRIGLSVLLALILSSLLLILAGRLLHIVDKIPVLNTINRLGGALIGLLFGVLVVWITMILILSFHEIEWCGTASYYIRQSPILSWLVHFNPLDLIK